MDTESLKLFALAADKLNISRAGRELGMGAAVASARLAKLEKTLGVELLHRSTRKISLSQEGAEFLPYAREIIAQQEAGLAALGLGRTITTGTLRFAAPSTFAQLYIAPILPRFLEQHPGIRLDLRLSDTLFDLIDGSFDLALRNSTLRDSSLKARKLAADRRVLCASPDYLARRGTPQAPAELSAHQVIAFKSNAVRQLISETGEVAVLEPSQANCRLVIDDGHCQKLATLAGAGISINSIWSVHQELKSGALVRVLPDYSLDDQTALWLVYPQSNVLTAKVRVLIDFLLDNIGKQPPWL